MSFCGMAMVLLLVGLLLTTLAAAQQRFLNTETTTKYAAIGLVEPLDGVTRVIGTVKRNEEPLMQQTEKWEARCDNGVCTVCSRTGPGFTHSLNQT